ncbi:acyl-CoA dehydrogenase family protein [Bradyrhizobium elkanii]|uniref:acyl-CoA dehydrogenase family protein n=1 Tax=Bradyrhizobium elkanii TaxID=29448 RepID=UPI00216AA89B|nr:acyl-CoA dehydrogenase family protein [Bradyrhizobium elkanii]MCS3520229.1 acyl-CoA dehydrogenase [Bradyrhizobium elkanii]MCS4067884.1 acyl-CoA dehydrogenase [Bradyrhizobium elkanii]MCS4083420.1 acyl-CoA dehydrogenase [Bradyrhizobium elkanii]MCW2126953.1 acyl-CoA dehydrogenase [Bradyrhizobium elkanii]MCW2173700.1 acyl-CoA dehydrogenase [Bradyrhizobium elkanii]
MIVDSVKFDRLLADIRTFVRELAIPNEDRVEAEDRLPDEIVSAGRRLGTFGWSIPREYGGSELTTEELALAFMELSQCSVAYRAHLATNAGIGSEGLIQDGTEEQKRKYLPMLASGEILGCLALTEPDAGSDVIGLRTTARATGDGQYRISGRKCYITLAPIADLFTVFARTDTNDPSASGISAFLIERGTVGLSPGKSTPKMGQEGAPIGEIVLDNCVVPATAIVGGVPGRGFKTVMKALNKQRINLAALCTGPAIRMLDEAKAYAQRRQQFGRPIAEFQLVHAMLAECKIEIEAARALILETARKRDRGEDVTMDVSICKYFATEMCGRVADRVVQIFGAQGYVKGTGIERFYRDVRAFRIYEGTSQIHLLNIAKRLLDQMGRSHQAR